MKSMSHSCSFYFSVLYKAKPVVTSITNPVWLLYNQEQNQGNRCEGDRESTG